MPLFPSYIERWRPLVSQYFPAGAVDEALKVMELESGGNASKPSTFNAKGTENSWGLFQINLRAHPLTVAQAIDPEQNIKYAAKLYSEQGWQPWSAARTSQFKNFVGEIGRTVGSQESSLSQPAVRGVSSKSPDPGPPPTPPDIANFYQTDTKTGMRKLDQAGYNSALQDYYDQLTQWQDARMRQITLDEATSGNDQLGAYMDDVISEYGARIEAGKLTLDQGLQEFNRRIKAFDSGADMYTKLAGYALRPGATQHAHSDFFSGIGLNEEPVNTQAINPFEMAYNASVAQSPNLVAGVPEFPDVAALYANNPFATALEQSGGSPATGAPATLPPVANKITPPNFAGGVIPNAITPPQLGGSAGLAGRNIFPSSPLGSNPFAMALAALANQARNMYSGASGISTFTR